MRIAMSSAASGLLRVLLARAAIPRHRILLTQLESAEWQSLTFTGERHRIRLRVPGPGAKAIVDRLTRSLGEAEFAILGQIVADIAVEGEPLCEVDGSASLTIEALTIAE
jgi:hypothetical protein